MIVNARRLTTYLVLMGSAAGILFAAPDVYAQSSTQVISVSPASADISVDPGGSISRSFDVLNTGTNEYTVHLSTAPYYVTGLNYDPHFTQLPGTLVASEWISLDADSVQLPVGAKTSVGYTVTVPSATPAGGYYAVIFAETSQGSTDSTGIIPRKRIGNLIYISVNGEVRKSGALEGDPIPRFSFSQVIPLAVRVANDGGTHFITEVNFSVTDAAGNVVYDTDFERIVLPSTERGISAVWSVAAPIGVYTVQRQATVAGETISLEGQKIIIVSPWFVLFTGTLMVAVSAFGVLIYKKRKRHKRSTSMLV